MRIGVFFVIMVTIFVEFACGYEESASVELVPYKKFNETWVPDLKADSTEIQGLFSPMAPVQGAEGLLTQLYACQTDLTRIVQENAPWIALFKLTPPKEECIPLYKMAHWAIKQGASAVIFDITQNPEGVTQMQKEASSKSRSSPSLHKPLILVSGEQARMFMDMFVRFNKQRIYIRIQHIPSTGQPGNGGKHFFDLGIFIGLLGLLCLISFFVIVKLKWRSKRRQPSVTDIAKKILSKMETRRYHGSEVRSKSTIDTDTCAICLEEYREGQELRILPCRHEFHRSCVDPWLIANRTCPLCLYNIIECPGDNEGSLCSTPELSAPQPNIPTQTHPSVIHSNNHHSNLYTNYVSMATSAHHHGYPLGFHDNQQLADCMVSTSHPMDVYASVYTPSNYNTSIYGHMGGYTSPPCSPGPAHLHYDGEVTPRLSPNQPTDWCHQPGAQTHSSNYSNVFLARDCVQQRRSLAEDRRAHAATVAAGQLLSRTLGRKPPHKAISGKSRHRVATGGRSRHRLIGGRTRGVTKPLAPHKHITLSSSDSEHETHRRRYHHYPSSHCDADVSGTSTGGLDSDTPCSCSPAKTRVLGDCSVETSNQSLYGSSSGMPSDISSYDSSIYKVREAGGEGLCEQPSPPTLFLPPVKLNPTCLTGKSRCSLTPQFLSPSRRPPNSKLKQDISRNPWKRQNNPSDSDNSVSSVDTSGFSPSVSDWAASSNSDNNMAPSEFTIPQFFASGRAGSPSEACPLCNNRTLPKSPSLYPNTSIPQKHNMEANDEPNPLTPLMGQVKATRGSPERKIPHSHSEIAGLYSCHICRNNQTIQHCSQNKDMFIPTSRHHCSFPVSKPCSAPLCSKKCRICQLHQSGCHSNSDSLQASPVAKRNSSSRNRSNRSASTSPCRILTDQCENKERKPRRDSYVIYRESQGEVSTLPLHRKENYDPDNAV